MSNQTIIALYDDKASARQVLEELRAAGFGDEFWISGDSSYGSTGTGRFSSLNSDFSTPGSRTSALTRLGVPEDEAQVYSEAVRRGGMLLVGQVDDSQTQKALDIIERHNPVDATERGAFYRQSGWTGYDATAADYDETTAAEERTRYGSGIAAAASGLRDVNTTTGTGATGTGIGGTGIGTDREEVIPITEESLAVGKREVERGRVRVRSRIVETPVEETVTLRDETVHVERRAVNRDATDIPADAFRERTIEVTETDEEAVVAKTARVVEEVVVRKDVTEEAHTVRDTVRRTEVEVEDGRTDVAGQRPLKDRDRTDI
jgi:uncharacterized protein (TIGR02271 family)